MNSDIRMCCLFIPWRAADFSVLLRRWYDLAFFEYFVTDHAGHSMEMGMSVEVLERMDGFPERDP
jgi:hypothetical protein